VAPEPNLTSAVRSAPGDNVSVDGHGPAGDGHAASAGDGVAASEAELDGLRQRLRTLPVVEQSKGLLIGYYGVDADTAFAILRRWSSQTNLKLREISAQLVTAASRPGPNGPRPALHDAIQRLNVRDPHLPD
jgi:hypothetical protein